MAFTDRLRGEMHEILRRRHDYSLRKLSVCTGLLGLGTLSISIGPDWQFVLPALLYVMPGIAIAFDLHIVAEDHRVKRAGIFLRHVAQHAHNDEIAYERFVGTTDNKIAPYTFFAVTMLMLVLSATALWTTAPNPSTFTVWLAAIVTSDAALVHRVATTRKQLAKSCPPKELTENRTPPPTT